MSLLKRKSAKTVSKKSEDDVGITSFLFRTMFCPNFELIFFHVRYDKTGLSIKGTLSRDLHMASYSRRYSTMKLIFVVSGVNDTADRWWAVSMTCADQGGRSVKFLLDPDPHSEKSGAGSDLNLTLSHSCTADQ
jgi:hypothetical protein